MKEDEFDKYHVNGGVFPPRFDYIKSKHGLQGVNDILSKMKEMGYDGPMSPDAFKTSVKYPFRYLMQFFKADLDLYGIEDLKRCSRAAAKKKGIIGFFIKWAGTPDILIRKAAEYWPNFYDFGRLEGEVIKDGYGVLKGYDASPEELFCTVLTAYFHGVMENLPVKNIRVEHTLCQHRGDDHCEWDLNWENK